VRRSTQYFPRRFFTVSLLFTRFLLFSRLFYAHSNVFNHIQRRQRRNKPNKKPREKNREKTQRVVVARDHFVYKRGKGDANDLWNARVIKS
jgi:hypothetical protein